MSFVERGLSGTVFGSRLLETFFRGRFHLHQFTVALIGGDGLSEICFRLCDGAVGLTDLQRDLLVDEIKNDVAALNVRVLGDEGGFDPAVDERGGVEHLIRVEVERVEHDAGLKSLDRRSSSGKRHGAIFHAIGDMSLVADVESDAVADQRQRQQKCREHADVKKCFHD